jgi:glycerophosphoryl diester phosphodiesterase
MGYSGFVIQGHRGARGLRPENTLPSIEAALDVGATSLEIDIHLNADGVPVVLHDPWLGGCFGADFAPPSTASCLWVHRLTSSQLRGYVAACNPNPIRFPQQSAEPTPLAVAFSRGSGHPYQVPTLEELFRFVKDYAGTLGERAGKTDEQRVNAASAVIDVEFKYVPFRAAEWGQQRSRFEERVLDIIQSADAASRTAVRCFDHRCVKRLRELEPGLTGVVLIEGSALVDPVAVARAAYAQVYGPNFTFLDEEQVQLCHAAGIKVLPWTVNDPVDWGRLVALGVDGITTDYPDRLATWLASRAPRVISTP